MNPEPATIRTRLPADRRRALILEAAARLFGERGYDGTTLDEVATASGVTKPILYRHFGSKRALYMALLVRHRDEMPSFVDFVPREEGGAVDLHAILDPWFRYARANAHGWQMLFRDAGGGEEIAEFRRRVALRATEVVAAFLDRAQVRLDPALLIPTAEMIRAGLAGLVLWWADHPDVPREEVVAAAVHLLQPAFAAPG
jgi:AcrR family transcriptional regulator